MTGRYPPTIPRRNRPGNGKMKTPRDRSRGVMA